MLSIDPLAMAETVNQVKQQKTQSHTGMGQEMEKRDSAF